MKKGTNRLFAYIFFSFVAAFAMIHLYPSKSVATTGTGTLTGRCAAMASNSSFFLTQNQSEYEVAWVGIFDFDARMARAVTSQDQVRAGTGSSAGVGSISTIETPFFLHDGATSGAYAGMYTMTFTNNPNSTDKLVLVPANSGNTIMILDIKLGATGVCQKI